MRADCVGARWASIGVLVLLAACETPVRSAVVKSAPVQRAEARFDPGVVVVDASALLGQLRQALVQDDALAALALLERPGARIPEEDRLLVEWLRAEAHAALEQTGEALTALARIAETDHPLSRWARLRRATILEPTDPQGAAAELESLLDEWAGQFRARTVYARSLAAAGRVELAVPALRALVAEAPDHVGAASAAMPLAALLEDSEDPAELEAAIHLYRRVATRAPGADVGQRAHERAEALLSRLPEDRRQALADVPVDDAYAEAMAFYRSMRHQDAEDAFGRVAGRSSEDAELQCSALLMQGKAMLRRRARDEGAAHMVEVASRCHEEDTRAHARFHAGKAYGTRGEHTLAIAQYEALEREAPQHRLADDALFHAALIAGSQGDTEGLVQRLTELPGRYPSGDMRGEARFILARTARLGGDYDVALAHLEASLSEGPGESAEDIMGRAAYWRARTLLDLERPAEAVEAFADLFVERPLSYYAQQSLTRLREVEPDRARALLAQLAGESTRQDLSFEQRPFMGQPAFRRALELLRVGAVDLATLEFEQLGLTGEDAESSDVWLAAALLDRAGALPEASRLARQRLREELMASPPHGEHLHRWRIAYPRAFAPLIEDCARAEGVPAAFVRAIAREESSFNPRAVSWAHAYGLVQLIRPTAQQVAARLELPSDPASLMQPDINLKLGTRYMATLSARFDGVLALVPSGYNAGGGAVDRWLRANGELSFDEWVEHIPYDETRRYTRRVLQTYGIYSWLDEGELPALPRALPPG